MEGYSRQELKIFMPRVCLRSQLGLLLGWRQDEDSTTCFTVTAVVENYHDWGLIEEQIRQSSVQDRPCVLGLIFDSISHPNGKTNILNIVKPDSGKTWVVLEKAEADLTHNVYMAGDSSGLGELLPHDVMVITYDAQQVISSVYLMDNNNYTQTDSSLANTSPRTNIDIVTNALYNYHKTKHHLATSGQLKSVDLKFIDHQPTRLESLYQVFRAAECLVIAIFRCFVAVGQFSSKVPLTWPYILCSPPAVYNQLRGRFQQACTAVSLLSNASPLQSHRKNNLIALTVLDVMLGMTLMSWLLEDSRTEKFSSYMMESAEYVATYLQNLLQWMMGFPAGLKLNSQLTKLLGKFFTYHIYLWTGYLSVLRPVQTSIVWVIATAGVLGMSVQLALMRDLVSMMTLHIYCFYVYAARLYRLQVYVLSSLWRLFRGKKWNVLRQRMDSVTFDIDQLFIGTLFFTILLFLLPTTALYYVVFTVLRLIVLSIQGTIFMLIRLINALPVAAISSRLVFPNVVSDRVMFRLQARDADKPLYLHMETQAAGMSTILTSLSRYNETTTTETWSGLIRKLFVGKLIYPWIEPTKHKIA